MTKYTVIYRTKMGEVCWAHVEATTPDAIVDTFYLGKVEFVFERWAVCVAASCE